MRIRTQLLLVATAVLIPVIVASALALERIREGERQASLRGLKETVRATALIIDGEMQGSLSALKALSLSRTLETRDLKAFYEQAAAFNQLPDVWTVLMNEEGAQLVNTSVPFGTPPPAPQALAVERVARVLAGGKPFVSDLVTGSVSGKRQITVNVPVPAAYGRSLVLAQVFTAGHWRNKALHKVLPAGWIVAVIDQKGRFISRNINPESATGETAWAELVTAAAGSGEGLLRHLTPEGTEVYEAFSHSARGGWTISVAAPVKSIEGAADLAVRFALFAMLAAIAITIYIVVAFGRRLLGALLDAGRSAAALGQGKIPSIQSTGVVEIDELNCALIDAGNLLDTERRGRQAAEAERERLLFNETLAKESALAENAAKDQFMAMLGHELRNPLATIAGATVLLAKSASTDVDVERYVAMINRQNHHLGRIVNDLLDVSRLMAGKVTLEKAPLDMADCVEKCVDALRTTDRSDGHTLRVRASPTWFSGDPVRMGQILDNLLTNALKFSAAGGEVCVTVSEDAGRVVVTVADDGAGISGELLSRVFEPFVQGPPPVNRATGGLGIGLALVRQLVRLHGGEVEVMSAGANQGSVFFFWVPAVAALPDSGWAPAKVQRFKRKLVYVEDNADARAMMAELLRIEGYEVVEVADGASALPAVLAERPDLVLSDIGLPDISGYEVARRLRAHPLTHAIPLVALTGYGQARDKNEAALAGFDRHLAKPVDPDALFAAIEEIMNLSGEMTSATA